MEKTANKQKNARRKDSAVRYRDPVDSCYTVSGSSDRNGFLQNKLRDLPEPVKLP